MLTPNNSITFILILSSYSNKNYIISSHYSLYMLLKLRQEICLYLFMTLRSHNSESVIHNIFIKLKRYWQLFWTEDIKFLSWFFNSPSLFRYIQVFVTCKFDTMWLIFPHIIQINITKWGISLKIMDTPIFFILSLSWKPLDITLSLHMEFTYFVAVKQLFHICGCKYCILKFEIKVF